MARKAPEDQPRPAHHGTNDVIGITLIFLALLLFLALLSYDPFDSAHVRVPTNNPPHNLGGTVGAAVSLGLFWVCGLPAYVLPTLLLIFGLGYIIPSLAHLRRSWFWAALLMLCCMGLLSVFENDLEVLRRARSGLGAPCVGGFIGQFFRDWVLNYFGKAGAAIVLGALYAISLMYLTNLRLMEWIRQEWNRKFHPELSADAAKEDAKEDAKEEVGDSLEKRAKDLEKKARKLQEEIDKKRGEAAAAGVDWVPSEKSGLGADLKPVPEPTVRDLSVPQSKTPRPKKEEKAASKAVEVGETIPAREVAAASTADILGKPAKAAAKPPEPVEPDPDAPAEDEPEEPAPVPAPRPRPAPRRPKPIAVAAPPKIGNYRLPPLDFLQYPVGIKEITMMSEVGISALSQNHRSQGHSILRVFYPESSHRQLQVFSLMD